MRVDHDLAPSAAQPEPAKDGSPQRREAESGLRPRPQPGWTLTSEKDPIDYDDGAWM